MAKSIEALANAGGEIQFYELETLIKDRIKELEDERAKKEKYNKKYIDEQYYTYHSLKQDEKYDKFEEEIRCISAKIEELERLFGE